MNLSFSQGFSEFGLKHPPYPSDPFRPALKKNPQPSLLLAFPGSPALTLSGLGLSPWKLCR